MLSIIMSEMFRQRERRHAVMNDDAHFVLKTETLVLMEIFRIRASFQTWECFPFTQNAI